MEINQQQLESGAFEMTDQQKFVAFTKWMDAMYKEQQKQSSELRDIWKKLDSINTILVIFLVIAIIGIVVSACGALGIG